MTLLTAINISTERREANELQGLSVADPGMKKRDISSHELGATPELEKYCKKQTVGVRMGTTNESWDYLAKTQFSAGQT